MHRWICLKIVLHPRYQSTPILIKFIFQGDIVATSGLSVKLCHIFNHLNSIQPQIIPLFHYIRIWIHLCGINMKRYVQYLLIFFYLEQNNYMPTIQKVQKNVQPEMVGGKFDFDFYFKFLF